MSTDVYVVTRTWGGVETVGVTVSESTALKLIEKDIEENHFACNSEWLDYIQSYLKRQTRSSNIEVWKKWALKNPDKAADLVDYMIEVFELKSDF